VGINPHQIRRKLNMKTANRIVSLVAILSLLAIVPASAQLDTTQDTDAGNLGLLITINRLELTTDQMQQIRDILVGILDEARALKEDRDAFKQQMLHFTGTGEELDVLVEEFREEQTSQASALQERAQIALEDLKGILTLKQGETLGSAFGHLLGIRFGGIALQEHGFQAGPLGMRGRAMGKNLSSGVQEKVMERLCERFGGEGAYSDHVQQFLSNRPGLQGRLVERDRKGFLNADPTSQPFVFGARSKRFAGLVLNKGEFGDRLLAQLEQVIGILDVKLQLAE
jgi:hypothetical protein